MPIDVFAPSLQPVIVQQNYLERRFEARLRPKLGYDRLSNIKPVNAREGESATRSRPALLPPITSNATPIVAGSDLNQGMTAQAYAYEQYQVFIYKIKGMLQLSLEMDETKIASEYLLNYDQLASQAGLSLDVRAAQRIFQAYDSGNSYATAGVTGTTVHVDNINGFDTTYTAAVAAGGSPGVPQATTQTNFVNVLIYSAANPTNPPTAAVVTGVAPDGTNASTANSGGIYYGRSGNLTFASSVTVGTGDVIIASDGCPVFRPNGKLSRAALTNQDISTLQIFMRARARLANRNIPRLPNGQYGALVDAEVAVDLSQDPAFQRATAQSFRGDSYFQEGVIGHAFGMEFVETTSNPVYTIPGQNGLVARHAMLVGDGVLEKCPFTGSFAAANLANSKNGVTVARRTNQDVIMIDRDPIDVEGDTFTQMWRFTGGHVCPTDVTSTPAQIQTTDYARYKRGLLIEVASAA